MGEEYYKFIWSNIDLDEFVDQRKFAANQLRREAQILMVRADQIDDEIHEWKMALELRDAE
jgi:chaperonin cofactor prefoldin